MSDTKESGGKLTLGKPGRLELKKTVDSGQVRQSFSHGRTKTVKVEKKRKRTFERNESGRMERVSLDPNAAPADTSPEEETKVESAPAPTPAPAPVANDAMGRLSPQERERRLKALEGAARVEEERRIAMEESERRAEEARRRREEEKQRQEEEEQARREEEARKAAEEAEKIAAAEAAAAKAEAGPSKPSEPAKKASTPKEEERRKEEKRATMRLKGEPRRRQGKLTISQALDGEDEEQRGRSLAALRRAREREKERNKEQLSRSEKVVRDVILPEAITVGDLANRMAERSGDVIKAMMNMGVMATVNQTIDADTAELIAEEFGHRIKRVSESDVEDALLVQIDNDDKNQVTRPPVVTVMGHVDHGKTSLLDALRSTDVAAGEAGGITQHIGAYQVKLSGGDQITFLDTPGHEAFTSMRQRGANVTDVVVLVVAADDGIQPQTIEAINHAKVANVPIIVAVNKCDKEGVDPSRVKNQLLEHEIVTEEFGGDVQAIEVSALKKINLDALEEAILLQAELLELTANPERAAAGVIIEAKLEKGRGSVATVLIKTGTLRVGDVFVAGAESGRVRALLNDRGQQIDEAGPSMPVEVLGLTGTPQAGDEFAVLKDEAKAREIAEYRQRKHRDTSASLSSRGTLEQMFDQIKAGEAQEFPVVIKTDVQGSLEAINAALEKMGTDEVKVRVLHGAVGGITESDVTLAASSNGVIFGFNVRANPQAREHARRDGVDIRYYSVIYDVIDDAKQVMSGMLAPEQRENFLGYAQIREVFGITKVGKVAGCMVTDGVVRRGAKVRLLRDDVVIHEGDLKQLKRFKDDVREVQNGYECGMAFANYDDIKEGDMIECFEVQEVAREL
ncbi:MAG: translation initiation factor IF-2 [Alphaproteobacteria bacterium]